MQTLGLNSSFLWSSITEQRTLSVDLLEKLDKPLETTPKLSDEINVHSDENILSIMSNLDGFNRIFSIFINNSTTEVSNLLI